MSERSIYTARCERTGKWWAISVPEVRGVHSQARRLDQAQDAAREAIALLLDRAADSFDVRLDVVLPEKWEGAVERARELRHAADECQRSARSATAGAVEALVREGGLPVRDAGVILGLSFQRVSAVLHNSTATLP